MPICIDFKDLDGNGISQKINDEIHYFDGENMLSTKEITNLLLEKPNVTLLSKEDYFKWIA